MGDDMPKDVVEGSAEWKGRTIASIVHQIDEWKTRALKAEAMLDNVDRLYPYRELGTELRVAGREVSDDEVYDFAQYHPDWWRNSALTDEGKWNVFLNFAGLSFTKAGRLAVLEQFGVKR